MITMPKKFDIGRPSIMGIETLLLQRQYTRDEPYHYNPLGKRTVMGYVVPDFQRPLVWDKSKQIRLIESIWIGMPIGTYSTNYLPDMKSQTCDEAPQQNLILDGQQRLMAIQEYLDDKFVVFGAKWSELGKNDIRRFKSSTFPSYQSCSTDETYLHEYYNRMNLGGVAHTEEDRA